MADLPFHPMIGNLIALLQLGGTIIFGGIIVKKLFQISGWLWELAVGMVVISQFAYLITFFPDDFWILDLLAWGLVFGGILLVGKIFYQKHYKHAVVLPKSLAGWIALVLSISYLLLALGPPTQADALDDHWGVPIYLMQQHQWPPTEIWLHGSLAGIGEVYILPACFCILKTKYSLQALGIIGFLTGLLGTSHTTEQNFTFVYLGMSNFTFLRYRAKATTFPPNINCPQFVPYCSA